MPRLAADRTPAYRRHGAGGQAVVPLNGTDVYLGPWGTRTSKAAYDRAVGEWMANGRRPATAAAPDLTIIEPVAGFVRHADAYYRRPDGTPTGEAAMCKASV